jgi:hypothetical protein
VIKKTQRSRDRYLVGQQAHVEQNSSGFNCLGSARHIRDLLKDLLLGIQLPRELLYFVLQHGQVCRHRYGVCKRTQELPNLQDTSSGQERRDFRCKSHVRNFVPSRGEEDPEATTKKEEEEEEEEEEKEAEEEQEQEEHLKESTKINQEKNSFFD